MSTENNRDEEPGEQIAVPRRRSLRERMEQAPSRHFDLAAAVAGDSAQLTSTSLSAITALSDLSTAFVVHDEGVSRTSALAPIAAPLKTTSPAGPLDLNCARSHHVFLLPDEVEPSEIEALALSIWDSAAWEGAGQLRLTGEARLEGPWTVDSASRRALGTPAAMPNAWILRCPPSPRRPVPASLAEVDEWARVCPEGIPTGLEYRVLSALKRIARRLGGALRVADTGEIIAPDPDSAVSLSIYTPRWLDPEDLLAELIEDFPKIIDSRRVPAPCPQAPHQLSPTGSHQPSATSPQPTLTHDAQSTLVRTDVAQKIAHAREVARERGQTEEASVCGYALLTPIANRSDLMIEVHPVTTPPRVLRWETWTSGVIIEYVLRWLPGGTALVPQRVSRAARLERMRSTRDIERAAARVVQAVGGSIIDEDGFLVALEDDLAAH